MFQFLMFIMVMGSQPSPPRLVPEPSFNSYTECAEAIPEHIITYQKALSVHGQPFALMLGCVKTGEKS